MDIFHLIKVKKIGNLFVQPLAHVLLNSTEKQDFPFGKGNGRRCQTS